MKDYVKEAQITFNTHALTYDKRTGDYINNYLKKEADLFLNLLGGKDIIDLGAGPGRDALYFKKKGFDVLCIDIADNMLKLCKEKGLKTKKIDINDIHKLKIKFDGVWSYTTLHLMPKEDLKKLLPRIKEILKPNGRLFIGMLEGEGEGWKENEAKFPGTKRWHAKYKKDELENILKENFKIIFFSRTFAINLDKNYTNKKKHYLNFICESL